MDTMTIVLFVLGLVLLVVGADMLVKGASRLASIMGISPLVVGLTVVAFGTSSPELAVSVQAALVSQGDIAIGNVVGSNILNVLFILGISAVITPLLVSQQLIRLDVPLMIGVSVLAWLLVLDGNLSQLEGLFLVGGLMAYITILIRLSRRESKAVAQEYAEAFAENTTPSAKAWLTNGALIIAGLAMLVLGSHWLVEGAVVFAKLMGLSELVIGLTIVALGTSLPEVATSIIAAVRGERDIAVGNVVGSNLFNIMGVLGLASLVSPDGIAVSAAAISFDIPIMIAVAIACLPIFFTGNTIARWEGAVFLGYYIVYTSYLIMRSAEHAMLPMFSEVMVSFVIPITVITLIVCTARAIRQRQAI